VGRKTLLNQSIITATHSIKPQSPVKEYQHIFVYPQNTIFMLFSYKCKNLKGKGGLILHKCCNRVNWSH